MKRTNNKGIMFIAVMILMALAGIMLLLMTHTSNRTGRQNRQLLLDANLNNLQLSAMAWVKQNYSKITSTPEDSYVFDLDAKELAIKEGTIKGIATRIDSSHHKIELKVVCRKAGRICEKTITYTYPGK